MNYIDSFNPAILLGDRLGLTLYGLFVEAYLNGKLNEAEQLYTRFIRHFPRERGIHTPAVFIRLIDVIRQKGFDLRTPVYANPAEYSLVEGAHRCAIAIQLGITEVPYNLRFSDDRTDEKVFRKIFTSSEIEMLYQKREEFIARCSPDVALRCRVRSIMRQSPSSFEAPFSSKTRVPTLRTYQAFESLGISGKRPAEKRFHIYELERYLNSNMNALEIGCNIGFFTLQYAPYVKSVTAFDIDSSYINIACLIQNYCGVNNCRFHQQALKDFRTNSQYDFVVSNAIHGWSGMSFSRYLELIDSCLAPGGLLLFESHEIDVEKDWPDKRCQLGDRYQIIDHGLIDDVDKNMYTSEMREFILCRKSHS